MRKVFSDLIENIGTGYFSLANKKATNANIFKEINKLQPAQINDLYKLTQVFKSCLSTSELELIKATMSKQTMRKTYKAKSLYKPLPQYEALYNQFTENHDIYFDLLQAKDVSTTDVALVYVHGFSMRNYSREYKIFSKLIANDKNLSVYTIQLPYHMSRAPQAQQYSGAYVFDSCPICTIESLRQAVHDVSQLISTIKNSHKSLMVAGFSLGGYVTSMLATCDNRADLYVIGQADSDLPTCMNNTTVCPGLQKNKSIWTNNKEKFQSFYEPLNLLNHKPAVTDNKIVSVAGKYDKLIEYKTVLKLREFFNSKYNIDYDAGHIGFVLEAKPVLTELLNAIAEEVEKNE